MKTIRVRLSAGTADVDVYGSQAADSAPLVIVAHGFWRNRHYMSGWGRRLAAEGFVAVVPDMPAWSDHARNGRFITSLRALLCSDEAWSRLVDPERMGLMGFSAGGLASLLSAAEGPAPGIWVGLDPVDHKGMGAEAASLLRMPRRRADCGAVRLQRQGECSSHYRRLAPLPTLQGRRCGPRGRRMAHRLESTGYLRPLERSKACPVLRTRARGPL